MRRLLSRSTRLCQVDVQRQTVTKKRNDNHPPCPSNDFSASMTSRLNPNRRTKTMKKVGSKWLKRRQPDLTCRNRKRVCWPIAWKSGTGFQLPSFHFRSDTCSRSILSYVHSIPFSLLSLSFGFISQRFPIFLLCTRFLGIWFDSFFLSVCDGPVLFDRWPKGIKERPNI